MKTLSHLSLASALLLAMVPLSSTGNAEFLGTWELPDTRAQRLFPQNPQSLVHATSPFDVCLFKFDYQISSLKDCIKSSLKNQKNQLLEAGFDEENLKKLSDYWGDQCIKIHPGLTELSQIGFLECFYNGRDSWDKN